MPQDVPQDGAGVSQGLCEGSQGFTLPPSSHQPTPSPWPPSPRFPTPAHPKLLSLSPLCPSFPQESQAGQSWSWGKLEHRFPNVPQLGGFSSREPFSGSEEAEERGPGAETLPTLPSRATTSPPRPHHVPIISPCPQLGFPAPPGTPSPSGSSAFPRCPPPWSRDTRANNPG